MSGTIENERPTNSADFDPIPIFPELRFVCFGTSLVVLTSAVDCFEWSGISLGISTCPTSLFF